MCKQFTCCCTGNEASLRFWCKDMISESTVFYCTAVLVGGKQIVKMLWSRCLNTVPTKNNGSTVPGTGNNAINNTFVA